MAGFVLYTGEAAAQTDTTLERAAAWLAPIGFDGLRSELRTPSAALAWHHGRKAPFEKYEGEAGIALLWGDALAYQSDAYLTAEEIYRSLSDGRAGQGAAGLTRYSGLFAWIFLERAGRVHAGADPFGLFPIYYFKEGEAFGLATSLTALHPHPAYRREIDHVGLMRYLIQNGSVGERTLEASGRRLEISCSLHYDCRSGQLKLNQHPIPGHQEGAKTEGEQEAVMQSVDATRNAVRRAVQRPPDHALLSGGLDSRHLLALAREFGAEPICCTAGRPSDYEAFAAARVAKELRLPWRCQDDSVETLEQDIENDLRLNSLGGGFSTVTLNAGLALNRTSGHRYFGGLVLDAHYAPYELTEAQPLESSFDYAFTNWINRFGVEPETLATLCVNAAMEDALREAMEEIRREFAIIEERFASFNDRVWWAIMRFRVRPHLGCHSWKESFEAWPVLPGLDLPMVASLRSIADEHFLLRRLQRETLRVISPTLAGIPLIGMSHHPKPISPNLKAYLCGKYLQTRAQLMGRARRDRYHRFVRAMNLNYPAWQRVRALAEPGRPALAAYFKTEPMDAFLPGPSESFAKAGTQIRSQGGRRMLYGLMLWQAWKERS